MTEFEDQVAEALWASIKGKPTVAGGVIGMIEEQIAPRVAAAVEAAAFSADNTRLRQNILMARDAALQALRGDRV